jgi:hypothetical protein
VELIHEAIVGWRVWRLGSIKRMDSTTEVFLRSCVRSDFWQPLQRLEAACVRHALPSRTCECGIYALKARTEALEWARWARSVFPNAVVIGQVNLWGNVLQFSRGYRAQYAYPYHLEIGDDVALELDPDEVARQLRTSYLIDVIRR